MAGVAREIGDHQRHHHREHSGSDAVEQLHGKKQRRIAHRGEQQPADRQRGKTDQQ